MPVKAEGKLLGGRYRILDRLGSGGMATVFLCEDERLGRKVAVKRLHAETPGDTARRFRREAKLGASLNHQNVVSIFDAVSDDDGVLIVMEYVEGENLAECLRRERGLEPERALPILRGIAAALDHAHAAGVVHRDVKPANILIDTSGEAKLADLGIAKALEGTRITSEGAVLGTASYMAPEQIDGGEPVPASDVYSLATVAFETLSGHKARVGRTHVEIATRIVSEPPPLLSDVWPEAPPEAVEAICRGMARDPEHRPGTARELVEMLEAGLAAASPTNTTAHLDRTAAVPPVETDPQPVVRTRASRRPNRGRPAWLVPAAVLGALAALLIFGAVLLSGGGDGGGESRQAEEPRGDAAGQREEGGSGSAEEPNEGAAPAPSAGSGAAGSPEEAVQSFYERAAADDFEGAWKLASPAFQSQLGGYDAFVAQQRSLESIEFTKLEPNGERVEIETIARHTDYTDHCTGTARAVQREGGWQIDGLDALECTKG